MQLAFSLLLYQLSYLAPEKHSGGRAGKARYLIVNCSKRQGAGKSCKAVHELPAPRANSSLPRRESA